VTSRRDVPPRGSLASRLLDARASGGLAALSVLVASLHLVLDPGVQSLGDVAPVLIAVVFLTVPRRIPPWALTVSTLLAMAAFTAMSVGLPAASVPGAGQVLLVLAAICVSALRSRVEAWLHVAWVVAQYAALTAVTGRHEPAFAVDVLATVAAVVAVTTVTTRVRDYVDDLAAVLLVDVDHFKSVNDVHGHLAGDEALVWLADLLRAALPRTSVVGRFGGEEFVAVLPGTDAARAHQHAEELRALVATGSAGRATRFTVSIGLATGTVDHLLDAVLDRADAAVYRAKLDGRDRVATWCPADDAARGRAVAAEGSTAPPPGVPAPRRAPEALRAPGGATSVVAARD
jgi:diguanylate cyclase (GGDEF)-like protein